ncbi:diacylglycerol/lipid kinase family protein [Prosthecomicrobium sp. N25]|uniref:diacylglycerol/lipid kinase family protein n=1 Tax=Prosthecomicrobium sp. N25 TaxID=3129254 RepID=UPI0030778464
MTTAADPRGAGPGRVAGGARVLVVANPTAGGYRAERVAALVSACRSLGLRAEARLTTGPGDLGRIAADPELAADVLVVAGGDGSVNEAAAGLLRRAGPRPALAVLPSGTANVLAAELSLPRRPAEVAAAVAGGRTLPLWPGLANARPFLLMASAGFDAEVVHAVDPAAKRRWKKLAFVATAFGRGFRGGRPDLHVTADGERLTGRLAIVTKAARYGGPHVLVRAANVTRPGLHLVLVLTDRPVALMRLGLALLAGRVRPGPAVEIRAVRRVTLEADGPVPVPVQIDGEAFGTTPVTIEEAAECLRILVPPGPTP